MKTIIQSTIRLFKAVPVETKKKKIDKEILKKTIKKGFILSPEVIYNYPDCDSLIKLIEKSVGITAEKLNSAFHKSWIKIKEADMEQLVVEQLAHYLTTYGKEQPEEYLEEKGEQWEVDNLGNKIIGLGDFESDKIGTNYVYIPKEKLEIPELDIKGLRLIVIKGYTKKELKVKLLDLLSSGIALGEDTISDVLDVATFIEVDEKDIKDIKNKEVKAALYDYLNLFPENPVEFLRYIVHKATDKTLLIKNSELIELIKESKKNKDMVKLFNEYDKKYGFNRLAEIFYRFKPIFLAFRNNKSSKSIINRIRRLAIKYHKPLPEDFLNMVTAKLKKNGRINKTILENELKKVNIFRKIRLAYALKFRTKDIDSILYRVRNGKSYATSFNFEKKSGAKRVLDVVLKSIIKDVSKNVKGKKIYIPDYINYSLPSTEKQFTGNFPSGTYVSIPKDMMVGINWENVKSHVIDLDLSVISQEGKIGWDASYRTDSGNILFSGDITNARGKNGATELFYIKKQIKKALILIVNYYNYDSDTEVPFKIIVAKEETNNFGRNYMVDPNNLISIAKSKIDQKQKVLGLIVTTLNESRFYFAEAYVGNSISSSNSEIADISRKYLFNFYENTINFKDILEKAGAKLIENKDKADIDLSPEVLEKDSILGLIVVKK